MTVLVDTSGLLALLNADDLNHFQARSVWSELIDSDETLVCNNYVVVETMALAHHRLGLMAARDFHEAILPVLHIEWITEDHHLSAAAAMLAASRRGLSLVDCASFGTAYRHGVKLAFAFDRHFEEQGITCLRAPEADQS